LKDTAHLQGAITLNGGALPVDAEGAITFKPASGGQGRTVTVPIVAGQYDSPDTPKGAVKAYLVISKPTGRTYKSERTGAQVAEVASIVPPKYGAGVDLEVTGDATDQNFELASE
jgi:hypothetical protein